MANEFLDNYVGRIRRYLRDFKEKNKLLEDKDGDPAFESTNQEIEDAIDAVYQDALIAPPVKLTSSLEDITKYLWFQFGVVAYLLDATVFESIRNTLPLTDGGISIDDNFKSAGFSVAAQNLWVKYDAGLQKQKIKENLENFQWYGTSGANASYGRWGYGYWR